MNYSILIQTFCYSTHLVLRNVKVNWPIKSHAKRVYNHLESKGNMLNALCFRNRNSNIAVIMPIIMARLVTKCWLTQSALSVWGADFKYSGQNQNIYQRNLLSPKLCTWTFLTSIIQFDQLYSYVFFELSILTIVSFGCYNNLHSFSKAFW